MSWKDTIFIKVPRKDFPCVRGEAFLYSERKPDYYWSCEGQTFPPYKYDPDAATCSEDFAFCNHLERCKKECNYKKPVEEKVVVEPIKPKTNGGDVWKRLILNRRSNQEPKKEKI
jgi:hypothetical protein